MADQTKIVERRRRLDQVRVKRLEAAARLKAKMLKVRRPPANKSVRSGSQEQIEDALFAAVWPKDMSAVSMHRMAAVQLTIHGEPTSSEVARVTDALLVLLKSAGFLPYRSLPQRTGSAIIPIIVITAERATAREASERADALRTALQQDADLKKTKSETLLNYAKTFGVIIALLGLSVSLVFKFPEKVTFSPEGATFEWSSPKVNPQPGKTIKLKDRTNPPVEGADR